MKKVTLKKKFNYASGLDFSELMHIKSEPLFTMKIKKKVADRIQ